MALRRDLAPASTGASGEREGNQGGNNGDDLKGGLFHGVLLDGMEAVSLGLPTEEEHTHTTSCRQEAQAKVIWISTQSKLQRKHKPENFRLQWAG
jgi:hypothetical protein